MKIHNYTIKHTKDIYGNDWYSIYNVWFGFLKLPFAEYELSSAICIKSKWMIYKRHYKYQSLESAKTALNNYLNNNSINYRGYTLRRCHNSMWVNLSSGEKPICHDWLEYSIGGTLEQTKQLVDEDIKCKERTKFKEFLKV